VSDGKSSHSHVGCLTKNKNKITDGTFISFNIFRRKNETKILKNKFLGHDTTKNFDVQTTHSYFAVYFKTTIFEIFSNSFVNL